MNDPNADESSPSRSPRPALPPELAGTVPRRVPDECWTSPGMLRTRNRLLTTFVCGVILMGLWCAPLIETWSWYLLPLTYVWVLGLGLMIIGGVGFVWFKAVGGQTRYIERGTAVMGRVENVSMERIEVEGNVSLQPQIKVEFEEPNGRTRNHRFTFPPKSVDEALLNRIRPSVGDWLPVVWMPSARDGTLALYDSLGLMGRDGRPPLAGPDWVWTRREGVSRRPTPLWVNLVTLVLIGAAVFGIGWTIWILSCHPTLDDPTLAVWLGCGVGGVVLAVLIAAGGYVAGRHPSGLNFSDEALASLSAEVSEESTDGTPPESFDHQRSAASPDAPRLSKLINGLKKSWALMGNLQAILFVAAFIAGSIGICGLLCYAALATGNQVLDTKPPIRMLATVDRRMSTTHNYVARTYWIEVTLINPPRKGQSIEITMTPPDLDELDGPLADVFVGEGRFGWPYVRDVRPLKLLNEDPTK